jgi:hypothetical protein
MWKLAFTCFLGFMLGFMFLFLLTYSGAKGALCMSLDNTEKFRQNAPVREPDGRLRDTLSPEETAARDTLRRAFCGMK